LIVVVADLFSFSMVVLQEKDAKALGAHAYLASGDAKQMEAGAAVV
jgi:hypothetical protein